MEIRRTVMVCESKGKTAPYCIYMSLPFFFLLLPRTQRICLLHGSYRRLEQARSASSAFVPLPRSAIFWVLQAFIMASLVPLPPVVVSRLAFPDYSSVVELVAAHDCDYPEESPRLWRARIKLPPWLPPKQSIGGRFPVLHGAEEHETSRVPETASKSVHPDYEASKRLWDRAGSSYPEMRYFLWQPQVKLPLLGDGSRCERELHP